MSTTQLRAFHFVALAGGFSQAAREMATGQSTLSAQVRQLEASSGINFFERKPRGVVLTPEGQALFELTSRLFAAEAEARAFLRDEAGRTGGHLRVAADGAFLSLPVLARLRGVRPRLGFTLAIDNSDRVVELIVSYRADVGITARLPGDPRLYARHFASMSLGLCVPNEHELARCASVAMADIAGLPFVMRERGSLTREMFERNLAEHDVTLGPTLEISTREGVREAVATGFGISAVTRHEFGHDTRLSFVPIHDARQVIREYAVCLAERRHLPLVREFFAQADLWGEAQGGADGTRPAGRA
ncbi:LysR family transcriptional regulator [Bosea caraganae]|uniref:LysR family transcriptional regulator n=1 Tax=Bosea caraganae TaxID=2763117 RepID=A0A370L628_9HYPH|nr:LysR family transcriptional regulator [Bosea caraganae]RDJ23166.1 LysR family transcriptional regulator [Bosea caraganae]RDJ24721.1 LysR family transcriptional regulator [Bosea caraganae]